MKQLISIFILAIFFASCQEEFTPETVGQEEFVVEGFVEAGEGTNPAYVIITRSLPFLQEINSDIFENLFVSDAIVQVSDGINNVTFTPLCLNDLPEDVQMGITNQLGLLSDSLEVNYCIYVDALDALDRVAGGSYALDIQIDDHIITGTTTIPKIPVLDSLWFQDTPGVSIDSLAELWATVHDELDVENFYRFLSGSTNGALQAPFASVTDDVFFDGEEFDFPVAKPQDRDEDIDPDTFGYYAVGDTIRLKWMSIDKVHYDFWLTYEYVLNSPGPFTSYIRVKHNLDGAIGVWGGYGVNSNTLIVQK